MLVNRGLNDLIEPVNFICKSKLKEVFAKFQPSIQAGNTKGAVVLAKTGVKGTTAKLNNFAKCYFQFSRIIMFSKRGNLSIAYLVNG